MTNDDMDEARTRLRGKARHTGNMFRVLFGSIADHPEPTQEAVHHAGVTSRVMEATSEWAERQGDRLVYFGHYLQALRRTADFGRDQFAEVQDQALVDLVGPDFSTDDDGETTVSGNTTTVTTRTTEVHLAETTPEQPMAAKEKEDLS